MALFFRRSVGLLRVYGAFSTKAPAVAEKLVFSEFGDPVKVLRKETEKIRAPKPNEVVVRMLAAPVNPADINTIQGVYPIKPPLPAVAGNEGVGEIAAVGEDVKILKIGDKVLPKGVGFGTWRSAGVCNANSVFKVSDKLKIVEAATLSVNPCTAFRLLKDYVVLRRGDTVIQNGANSACGQNVIQMCKAWGINTVNIVRNREDIENLKDYLTMLGATHVCIEEEVRSLDIFKKGIVPKPQLALNCVGGRSALEMMRHLDQGGYMVTYGGMSRQPVTVPTSSFIFRDLRFAGFWMTRWSVVYENTPIQLEMFDDLTRMIIEGNLRPPMHKMVAFSDYEEAINNTLSPKGFVGKKYILDFSGY